MSRLRGKVIVTRPHGGDGPEGVCISLTDDLSRTQCVEIHVGLAEFTRALTASYAECEFEWRPSLVGLKREHKTELVPRTPHGATAADMDAILAPFETDGWKGSRSDLTNTHRRVGDHARVSFVRHVPPDREAGVEVGSDG